MISLNDYLYSGDTVLKILQNYSADLKKASLENHNAIDKIIHAKKSTELSDEKIKQIIEVLNTQNKIQTMKKVKVYKK